MCRKTKGSAQFDGEEPGVDGGLAFGEGDGLSADGEFGGEEIVVADDQQAVIGKQGETFPLFRQLIPRESFGRKVEGIKIKQGAGLHVLDVLFGVEFLELGIGGAEGVGLVCEFEQICGMRKIQRDDLFENGGFGFVGTVLAVIVPLDGDEATVGQEADFCEGDIFAFEFADLFSEGGGIGEADGIFLFRGTGERVEGEQAGSAGLFSAVLHESGLEYGVDGFSIRGEGDTFKAAVVFATFLPVGVFGKVDFAGVGIAWEIVVGRDQSGHEGSVGFKLDNGGVVLLRDKEVSVLHDGEAFGIQAAAAVLHPGFGFGGVGDQAGEGFSIGIFVQPSRTLLG